MLPIEAAGEWLPAVIHPHPHPPHCLPQNDCNTSTIQLGLPNLIKCVSFLIYLLLPLTRIVNIYKKVVY